MTRASDLNAEIKAAVESTFGSATAPNFSIFTQLSSATDNTFTFDSLSIAEDPKAIRSQRTFTIGSDHFHYEMNMATHAAGFQNHLQADLKRADFQ